MPFPWVLKRHPHACVLVRVYMHLFPHVASAVACGSGLVRRGGLFAVVSPPPRAGGSAYNRRERLSVFPVYERIALLAFARSESAAPTAIRRGLSLHKRRL